MRHGLVAIHMGNRTDSRSKTRMNLLSPVSLMKRAHSLVQEKRNLKRHVARLSLKLKRTAESHLVDFHGEGATKILAEAFKHVTTSRSKKQLTQEMVEILVKEGSARIDGFNRSELKTFSERVCELIHNKSRKITGNMKQVRFDFRTKRLEPFRN